MPLICFVSGCDSGSKLRTSFNKKAGLRNYTLFRARNEEMLSKWRNVVPQPKRLFTAKDALCELHFNSSDIEREFITIMPDGSIFRLEREVTKLNPDAVPCIFQQMGASSPRKRARANYTDIQSTIFESSMSNTIVEAYCPAPEVSVDEVCNANEMVLKASADPLSTFTNEDLSQINIPKSWSACIIRGSMCFMLFNSDLSVIKRRIVLNFDLSLMAFICENKIQHDQILSIENISEVPNMLLELQELKECIGANESDRSPACTIYAPKKKRDHFVERCAPCSQFRQYLIKKVEENKLNKLKLLNRNTSRLNKRLKANV